MQSIHVRTHFPLQFELNFWDTKEIILESLLTGVRIISPVLFTCIHTALQFSQDAGRGSTSDHGGSDYLENWY